MGGFKITSKIIRDVSPATFNDLRRRADMQNAEVHVGIPAGKKYKMPKGSKAEPADLATIGMVHEFGSPARGIPERPWLRPGVLSGKVSYIQLNRINLVKIMSGQMNAVTALGQLGAMAVGMVQRFIRAGVFTPLAESTIKAKGSSAPLIDTGQLIQSITFERVEKQKHD